MAFLTRMTVLAIALAMSACVAVVAEDPFDRGVLAYQPRRTAIAGWSSCDWASSRPR